MRSHEDKRIERDLREARSLAARSRARALLVSVFHWRGTLATRLPHTIRCELQERALPLVVVPRRGLDWRTVAGAPSSACRRLAAMVREVLTRDGITFAGPAIRSER